MLHHSFGRDDPLRFVWSEIYENVKAFLAHLGNSALAVFLEAHFDSVIKL